jgi:prevent-host-death family protein
VAETNQWTLEKAKNSLSEVVRRALDHEPQVVVRGKRAEDAVVVVSRRDYEQLVAPRSLVEFFRASPLAEAVAAGAFGTVADDPFARTRDVGRDLSF